MPDDAAKFPSLRQLRPHLPRRRFRKRWWWLQANPHPRLRHRRQRYGMVLQRLVPEDLPFQLGQKVRDAADLGAHRLRQLVWSGNRRRRLSRRHLEGSRGPFTAQLVRDRERESLVHRPGADHRARQTADAQEHLAKILDPLAARLAAAQMIARPLEILPIQAIVEDRTGRDAGAAILLKI